MGKTKTSTNSTYEPKINNLDVQQSCYGVPVPIVYGTQKIAGNLIDYEDFTAIPHVTSTTTGTGKNSSISYNTSYTYQVTVLIALCQGIIKGINQVWKQKILTSVSQEGLTLFDGNYTQNAWGTMVTKHPDKALSYRGIGYVAGTVNLGTDTSLANYNFETSGIFALDTSIPLTAVETFNFMQSSAFGDVTCNIEFGKYYISNTSVQVTYLDNSLVQHVIDVYPHFTETTIPATASIAASAYYTVNLSYLNTNNATVVITYTYSTNLDANPSDIIYDLLTNKIYGRGTDPSLIADMTNYRNYCLANDIFFSDVLNSQSDLNSVITNYLLLSNSDVFLSQGQFKFKSYSDAAITNNGVTFSPDTTIQANFYDDDFVAGDETIICERTLNSDVYNSINVEYLDRKNSYSAAIANASDQSCVEMFGIKPAQSVQAHCVCQGSLASRIAQNLLQRQLYVRNTFTFTVSMKYCLLEPMDLISITSEQLGLTNQLCRIIEMQEDENYNLQIKAFEVPFGVHDSNIYSDKIPSKLNIDYNANAGNINAPIMFEPPFALTQDSLQLWLGASSANPMWGGANILGSNDDITYKNIGQILNPTRQGILSNQLGTSIVNPDITNVLSVDMSMSKSSMLSGTQYDADNLHTLCLVEDELLAYEHANLIDANKYDLTYLNRGAYNTSIKLHEPDTSFAIVDIPVFYKYPFTQADIGKTIYIKYQSFNVFGSGMQDLSVLEPYTYKLQGVGLYGAPDDIQDLSTYYKNGYLYVSWAYIDDTRPLLYEVRKGNSWGQSIILGRFAVNEMVAAGDGNYFVKAYVPSISFYSENAAELTIINSRVLQNIAAEFDEQFLGWNGNKVNCVTDSGNIRSSHEGEGTFSAMTDIALIPDIGMWGAGLVGYYTSTNIVDIGRAQLCSIACSYNFAADYLVYDFDLISDFDAVTDLDGSYPDEISRSKVQIRVAQDDGIFGDWQDINQVQYFGRMFNVRAILVSTDPTIVAVLTQLNWTVDMPDLIQSGTNIDVSDEGLSIIYTTPYQPILNNPSVQITILNEQSGDFISTLEQTSTGFAIVISNGDIPVSRALNYVAVGY